VDVFRGLERLRKDEFLWDLFSEFDPDRIIELSSRDSDNQVRSLSITIREHPISRVSLSNEKRDRENGRKLSAAEMVSQEATEPIETEMLLDYISPAGETLQAHAFVEPDTIRFERPPGVKESSGIFLATRRLDDLVALAERFSNPHLDLGLAAQAGYWPFDHPAFAQIKQFLKTL
jgi:hypothetical protein